MKPFILIRHGLALSLAGALGLAVSPVRADDPPESDILLEGAIVVTPDPILAGQEITVRYRIRNQGAGDTSGGFTTRVLIKNPNEFQFLQLDYLVPAVAAGQFSDQVHHITLPDDLFSGDYTVRLRLDPFFDIENEAERFNDASDPFAFAVISALPDLKVTFAEVCPHSAHAGDAVQLKFTVLNNGDSPAGTTKTRFELTDPKTNQRVFSNEMPTAGIPAHGTADFVYPFQIPATGLPGSWRVSIYLNDFSEFPESDTFNNVYDPLVNVKVVAAATVIDPCVAPIRLGNLHLTGGKLSFDVTGSGNDTLTLQSSVDLNTWNAAGTVTLSNGKGSYTTTLSSPAYFRAMK